MRSKGQQAGAGGTAVRCGSSEETAAGAAVTFGVGTVAALFGAICPDVLRVGLLPDVGLQGMVPTSGLPGPTPFSFPKIRRSGRSN